MLRGEVGVCVCVCKGQFLAPPTTKPTDNKEQRQILAQDPTSNSTMYDRPVQSASVVHQSTVQTESRYETRN